MFKKTLTKLKEINETPKEIVVTTTVDSDKVARNVIKTYAAIAGIYVATHFTIAFIDSRYPKSETLDED